jgi:lysylphosphatidylglycerol synthetase-like protein (DUF2156 family)
LRRELEAVARALTLLLGFGLTVASVNIYGQKKRAWVIVLSLSGASTIFHLARGHYKESLVFLALAALLALARSTFSVLQERTQYLGNPGALGDRWICGDRLRDRRLLVLG